MDIDTMPAGREMDVLIAEEVLGLTVWRTKQDAYAYAATHRGISVERTNPFGFPGILHPDGFYSALPHYSTDIAANRLVKDWLIAQWDGYFSLDRYPTKGWICANRDAYDRTHCRHVAGRGETEAEAVCRAAYNPAKGIEAANE